MTAPTTMASRDLSTRLRSSLMCSTRDILASGFTDLWLRGRRSLRSPALCAGSSGEADITLLDLVGLRPGFSRRRGSPLPRVTAGGLPMHVLKLSLQVVNLCLLRLHRRSAGQLRRRRVGLLCGLGLVSLLVVIALDRLLEDVHGAAKRLGRSGEPARAEQKQRSEQEQHDVPR